MRIYSMTATFGKLDHQTLTLEPGLNIIHAPNEWGKSTWCAFLIAMLYGIDTKERSTLTTLAVKERYAPWSGSPMSGRIDLHWEGKDITIERRTKGRSIFGEFQAYETATGLPVSDLTAANCGQVLLGVEKNVFTRAGFLRLSDLPVTQDESLRRRLNALVTTGDESGTADDLSQKLRDLKNRCRANRSNGLIPQAQAQKDSIDKKLRDLRELKEQTEKIRERQAQLEAHHNALLNHKNALDYQHNQDYAQRITAASTAKQTAALKLELLEQSCATLPQSDAIDRDLMQLRALREQRDSLQMEAQMLPSSPQPPQAPSCFARLTPEEAVLQAQTDYEAYENANQKHSFPWFAPILLLLSVAALWLHPWLGMILCACGVVTAIAMVVAYLLKSQNQRQFLAHLQTKYHPLPPESWTAEARRYLEILSAYQQDVAKYQADRGNWEQRMAAYQAAANTLTNGESLAAWEQHLLHAREQRNALAEAHREVKRCEELYLALESNRKEIMPPSQPDFMTYTREETARLLSDCVAEQRLLQGKLGHSLGQMEALGQEEHLQSQSDQIAQRLKQLETTFAALEIAQDTLSRATGELQRRFAPRITAQAQSLFRRLTHDRYDRLTLGEDFSICAGTPEEGTLHPALWRSEGTVDQLYLALRLAVAGELTPNAPLILDDALVRFDDTRLAQAISILKEEAASKQVILFTCQGREQQFK